MNSTYADVMGQMFEAAVRSAEQSAEMHEKALFRNEQERLKEQSRTRVPKVPTEGREVTLFGSKVLLPPSYFKEKTDVMVLAMLAQGHPETEKIFEAAGFEIFDTEGKKVFPRSPLERLADLAEE